MGMDERSPRMRALLAELAEAGNSGAAGEVAGRFWEEIARDGAPLVEPDPDDPGYRLVTFLWRDATPVRHVLHIEFWSGGDPAGQLLTRIPRTDVWYRTMALPATLRGTYRFGPDDTLEPFDDGAALAARVPGWRRDPLNPRRTLVGFDPVPEELTFFDSSVVELPAAEPLRWVDPPDAVSAGTVTHHRVASRSLGNERDVWLYRPPGEPDDPVGPLPLVVHFDGDWALRVMRLPRTLDRLIAAGAIPPVVVALVGNVDRGAELPPNDAFVAFLADELVPWVRERAGAATGGTAADVVVAGQSYGGIAATYAALTRPDVFGNVIAESASYWWLPDPASAMGDRRIGRAHAWEWLPRFVAGRPPVPVRWVLDVGILEARIAPPGGPSLLAGVRHMRDVLTATGHEVVRYHEFMGGHDPVWWCGLVAEGMVALLGDHPRR